MVRVVPDVPAIHKRFDYTVPAALSDAVSVGSRVRVPLHGRRVAAWVVEDGVTSDPGVHPVDLAGSSGIGPPPSVVALAEWAAWRWAGPVSSFLGTASPLRNVRAIPSRPSPESPTSPGGGSVALVDAALAAEGAAVVRLAPALDTTLPVLELVHRTGPADVLVLVPSRARAEHLAARLRAAAVPVALLPDEWAAARAGGCVVVGTRAAAWAPLARLRAAVVLDAHDEAFREERSRPGRPWTSWWNGAGATVRRRCCSARVRRSP